MLAVGAVGVWEVELSGGQLRSDMVKAEVLPNALFLSTLWNRIAAERAVLLELRECGDCRTASTGEAVGSTDCGQADRGCVHRGGAGERMERDNGQDIDGGRIFVDQRTSWCGLPGGLDWHS